MAVKGWYHPGEMEHSLNPPTSTSKVSAKSVLVLAPHADDEVLGCGGLLAQLAADGARIEVLYLTDSSGGLEVIADQAAYAERRQAEATLGLQKLGIDSAGRVLAIPDGSLGDRLDEATIAIRAALDDLEPDLVLSVSPLETSADHRAAFAALQRTLCRLRGSSGLAAAMTGCRFLLYEINHPCFPNLLVDVSGEVEAITDAVQAHESQLALHNYLDAGLGLRRYRTLTVGPEVKAAEAYRELSLADFITHSLASLVASIGGPVELVMADEGPLVSVVVRTKDRAELLEQALASIAASTYRQVEVVLVNDGGEPPVPPEGFPFPIRVVNLDVNRGRAAAANAGIAACGGEWVCFLDDDDRVLPEHFATLVGLTRAAGVRVAYTDAAVVVYHLDGDKGWAEKERRLTYSRDFDPDLLLFDNYIPFHTLIIERALLAEAGELDEGLIFFEDWDLLIRLALLTPFHHLPQVTCEYRHFRGGGHHILGDQPHERADFLGMKARLIERYSRHHSPELLARVIDRLRSEAVDLAEGGNAHGSTAADLRHRLGELEQSYHRLNGEAVGLRQEREGLIAERDAAEVERHRLNGEVDCAGREAVQLRHEIGELGLKMQERFDVEEELRRVVEDQEQHLQRVYAETERLQAVIEAMEASTGWKVAQAVRKLTGRG